MMDTITADQDWDEIAGEDAREAEWDAELRDYDPAQYEAFLEAQDAADKDAHCFQVTEAAHRIIKTLYGTDNDLGVYFDKYGRTVLVKPYTALYTGDLDDIAPGRVLYLRGCRGRGALGHMTLREAQVRLDAALRFGDRSDRAGWYVERAMEDLHELG